MALLKTQLLSSKLTVECVIYPQKNFPVRVLLPATKSHPSYATASNLSLRTHRVTQDRVRPALSSVVSSVRHHRASSV